MAPVRALVLAKPDFENGSAWTDLTWTDTRYNISPCLNSFSVWLLFLSASYISRVWTTTLKTQYRHNLKWKEVSLDVALCAYIDLSSGRPLHAIAAGSHHSRSLVLRGPDSASKCTRAKPRGGLFGL
jgi:hypothetical protein